MEKKPQESIESRPPPPSPPPVEEEVEHAAPAVDVEEQLAVLEELKHRRDMMDADAVKIMNVLNQYEKTISELIAEGDRHRVWRELEQEKLRAAQMQVSKRFL